MKKALAAIVLFAAVVWAMNTSMFVTPPAGTAKLLAHRGVHQTYSKANVGKDTCTATIIDTPQHPYLENTIASMQAAFDAGADVVELDVHLTPDKQFAVFHDWTLDCRTEGKGVTEETPMAMLKSLDIGYGYTADGGTSFRSAARVSARCRRWMKCWRPSPTASSWSTSRAGAQRKAQHSQH